MAISGFGQPQFYPYSAVSQQPKTHQVDETQQAQQPHGQAKHPSGGKLPMGPPPGVKPLASAEQLTYSKELEVRGLTSSGDDNTDYFTIQKFDYNALLEQQELLRKQLANGQDGSTTALSALNLIG